VDERVAETGRLQAEVAALRLELEAARSSIGDAAAAHQGEVERLQHELEELKAGLVSMQDSVSWRLTRPLRVARRLLARRG
jgi:hypothetical protein